MVGVDTATGWADGIDVEGAVAVGAEAGIEGSDWATVVEGIAVTTGVVAGRAVGTTFPAAGLAV